jgi:putative transposase
VSIKELSRKYNVSSKSIYNWKAKFGDISAREVRRTKELEALVVKLKRIVAQQAVELLAAKDIIKGKW